MSDYKPGQLAMVTAANRRDEYRAFFDGRTWRELDGHTYCVDAPTTIRPLVVLDLHNASKAAKVLRAQANAGVVAVGVDLLLHQIADQIEAQTRPAIEEPKGLGAVVRANKPDGLEATFVKVGEHTWVHFGNATHWTWDEITPVRVLSEGVPA